MNYSRICEIYLQLESTSSGLEKISILSNFLGEIKDKPEFIYLLRGQVFGDFESKELGVSHQLVIKAICRASGVGEDEIVGKFKEFGELGLVAEEVLGSKKKQASLFEERLTIEKVFLNLRKLVEIEGVGTVDLKVGHIVDLLHSASAREAKYVVYFVMLLRIIALSPKVLKTRRFVGWRFRRLMIKLQILRRFLSVHLKTNWRKLN